MKLLLAIERGLKAAALLREHVQQHRVIGGLEELEGFDEQRNVVPVDGPEVLQAKLLKEDGGPQHALGRFFGAAHHFDGGFAADALQDAGGTIVQVLVVLVGHDAVQVAGDGAHVAVDGPLIVVEHDDQAFRLLGDVVEGFKGDAVGESGVAGDGDHVLVSAGQVACHGHAQRRGERSARVAGAVAVVLALGAQHKAVEPAGLADGLKTIGAPGKQLVHVGLMAHVEENLVGWRFEDGVQGDGQFHHAEVRTQVAAGLRKRLNKKGTNLFGQIGHLRGLQALEIGRRLNRLQQVSHVFPSPGKAGLSREMLAAQQRRRESTLSAAKSPSDEGLWHSFANV